MALGFSLETDADQFLFDFVTFGADQVYDQKDAEGFIRLYSLPSRIRALNEQQRKH